MALQARRGLAAKVFRNCKTPLQQRSIMWAATIRSTMMHGLETKAHEKTTGDSMQHLQSRHVRETVESGDPGVWNGDGPAPGAANYHRTSNRQIQEQLHTPTVTSYMNSLGLGFLGRVMGAKYMGGLKSLTPYKTEDEEKADAHHEDCYGKTRSAPSHCGGVKDQALDAAKEVYTLLRNAHLPDADKTYAENLLL